MTTIFAKENPAIVGPFVQNLRTNHNITQQQVSDATGYSIQTISKFENGKSNPGSVASADIMTFIFEETKITPDKLKILFDMFAYENF